MNLKRISTDLREFEKLEKDNSTKNSISNRKSRRKRTKKLSLNKKTDQNLENGYDNEDEYNSYNSRDAPKNSLIIPISSKRDLLQNQKNKNRGEKRKTYEFQDENTEK